LHTQVATPTGWTTAGELHEGDEVLGTDGRAHKVTRVYPVQHRDCYRVSFKGGDSIIVDDVQEFTVSRNRNGACATGRQEIITLSATELRAQLRSASGQRHLRVMNPAPLELPELELPVHPYVLGCWLGDGDSHGGQITKPDEDLFDNIVSFGYAVGKNLRASREGNCEKRTILGLVTELKAAGVHKDKHIPAQYLRASRQQRLHLLQGLMDTDGSYNKGRKQCVFSTTDKALAAQVRELTLTLGWKAYVCDFAAHGFGVSTTAYQVMFTPTDANPFLLPRKAALVKAAPVGAGYRIVQSVEPVESVPTRCIDVDSDDHLYLAGDFFLPVHNCQSEAIRTRLRRDGPPFHYYIQLLLYAIGYMNLGHPVERIALISWPRTKSTLDDLYVWEKTITNADLLAVEEVLKKTVIREDAAKLVTAGRLGFFEIPATPSESDCQYCIFFNPAAMEDGTSAGCPGTAMLKPKVGYAA
jgi:replicative DNA helicase